MIKNEKGQAIVELALISTVLMSMLLASIDFGRLLSSYVIITNAANRGATYASSSINAAYDSNGIATAVNSETSSLILDPNEQLSISSNVSEDAYGHHQVQVTVTFSPALFFPIPGVLDHVTLHRSVTRMVQE